MTARARQVPGFAVFALSFLLLVAATGGALAQRMAGDFDFYVLALSWSPSYCEADGTPADRLQCESGRPYAFIVHGLWPQYELGWPEFCPVEPSRASESLVRGMLDLMPSEGLIRHQWAKHGTCSGLSPEGYFDMTRRARGQVSVPERLVRPGRQAQVSPDEVEQAFRAANPGLSADSIAVTCNRGLLREVRICLERHSLSFRPCPEVAERACRARSVRMPPTRSGR